MLLWKHLLLKNSRTKEEIILELRKYLGQNYNDNTEYQNIYMLQKSNLMNDLNIHLKKSVQEHQKKANRTEDIRK